MIKWLATLLFIPGVLFAENNSEEFLMGSLTYHFFNFGSGEKFSNKLDSNGTLITNPLLGYRNVIFDEPNNYYSWTIFGGQNSIGQPMGGGAFSMGVGNRSGRFGLVAGGYLQDNTKFYDRGLTVLNVPIGDHLAIAPVVGWELALNFDLSPRCYWTFYNLLTPALYTSALGIGWRL